jgi:hypothetical protein
MYIQDIHKHIRAILASTPANTAFPTPFRTYPVRANETPDCTIWQAIRATTASARFSPVDIGGELFSSARDLGHSNPIDFALSEYRAVHPEATVGCIISIGSGHPGHNSYDPTNQESLIEHNTRFSADPERLADSALRRLYQQNLGHLYFRFSVVQGLQLDRQSDIKVVSSHVRAYLQTPLHDQRMDQALSILKGVQQGVEVPEQGNLSSHVVGICFH